MVDILEELNKNYNNKYKYLKLLEVVFDKELSCCTITFLYPYQMDEIPHDDKTEIQEFFQKFFSLNSELKIKLKKSFLDEKLIVSDVIDFFSTNKKALIPFIESSNISSNYKDSDVFVKISLNQDVLSIIDEVLLKQEIYEYLSELYIANFHIDIVENENVLPDKIEADDIPMAKKQARFNVEIEKKLVGGDIIPKPEFIKDNKKPKESVILAGIMTNLMQKNIIIKKGRNQGMEKALYTFNITDGKDIIDCVYFSSKTNEKIMNSLEEGIYLLCVGDIRNGLNGKLSYTVHKISLAHYSEKQDEKPQENLWLKQHKQVVFPKLLPQSEQVNLFAEKEKYNDFIMNNNIVVYDLETTGFNPEFCEITEIGAVKIEHGEITEYFSSFARTKHPIPIEVQELTHITNEMIADAPRIENVIIDFYEWSKDCVLSGHNVIGFDMKFLNKVANDVGIKFDNPIVDTLIVSRQSGLRVTNYKLGTLAKYFDISLVGAHRAFNDANATAQVLLKLNKKQ